jgi:hypothetical protein
MSFVFRYQPHARRLAVASLLIACVAFEPATGQDTDEKGLELYKSKIKKILVDNCYECHSTKEDRYESGLDVQFRRTLLDGGDRGAAIEPGDPEDSLLMTAIGYEEEDLEMPPEGKLDADEIKLIAEWIRLGAPMPVEASSDD